jgi:hypothetical protein
VDEYREEQALEETRNALRATQRQLAQAKQRTDELVVVTHEAAKQAMLAMGGVPNVVGPKPTKSKKQKEVALWHLSDWQGAKVTTSYNSQVMRDRVMLFCEKAAHITEIQRADHPVDEVYILLGGDLVEGLFNFPTQAHEIDATIFTQYVTVARLLVDVVRFALSVYSHVTVIGEWGNHGRIGSKRDAVPRHDNLDRMSMELARQMLAGHPNLVWEDSAEDVQRVHIPDPTGKGMGYRAVLIHGDEIGRGGFASPMTIVRHVERWQSGAYPWEFRDCYVGHYHTHACWPLASGLGSVYQTGSTESDNRYAGVMLAASATPSQRLHFIDPVRGRVTAEYKVWLTD